MQMRRFLLGVSLLIVTLGGGMLRDQAETAADTLLERVKPIIERRKQDMDAARERGAAATRQAARRQAAQANTVGPGASIAMTVPIPGMMPDYFGSPNWAFSPPLRKFIDSLPGLGTNNRNNLGQFIPIAVPDTTSYPGSDYYEIDLVEYQEQMHSELPPTTLRGYVQSNGGEGRPHYLGPLIIAQRNRPVRIKFTNMLPTGSGGDLFIPVDTTVMGAGMGPLGMDAMPMNYTQNRGTLHLHGGKSPWISDGTPHQWVTPAGEDTPYPKGVSVRNVPDMPDPGDGSVTFFYSNQQSARLMFYHDHSFGITRLNVYAGEAAGYLITDEVEQDLIDRKLIPAEQIPLIIQDKSFVDASTVRMTDPLWNWGTGRLDTTTGIREPNTGDLWYPHVYSPAQNPGDISGVNPYGRWHYGPWFWPPTTNIAHGPVPNPYYDPVNAPWEPPLAPGVPHPSIPGESFFDTPVVNGTAFPTLAVDPKPYRFRILNASNDRFWNLQLYLADPTVITTDSRTNTEVKMMPANKTVGFPENWPTDGREGGVPDPSTAGPEFIQIGTEGGFLPKPVIVPNQPITWNADPTTFNFGNVDLHALLLGPAERADVIIDFSQYAGKTLILYNDAPAAFPALDVRYDYYTGAPDLTETGGHPGPQAGFGPNIRTIMQITVAAIPPSPAFDLPALQAAFTSTADAPGVFERGQDPVIIPNSEYNSAYNAAFPIDAFVRIFETSKTFGTVDGTTVTFPLEPKAIQDEMGEAFDLEYGRMSGKLGVELPGTMSGNQNFVLQNYIDPPTEIMNGMMTPLTPVLGDGTQIWKITHNGVDTHPIHFHLFDVQLINRVGWDGAIRKPDANELGWKDTVRVSPLEDTIVAMRPILPAQPFGIPDSIRLLDPTMPEGSDIGFTGTNPLTGQPMNPPVTNTMTNFGWEYVWHCHILSHEEMDMMRPMVVHGASALPMAPVLSVIRYENWVDLAWTDGTPFDDPATWGNPANEIGFRIERAIVDKEGLPGVYEIIGSALANAIAFSDLTQDPTATYSYRVVAFSAAGDSPSNTVTVVPLATIVAAPGDLTATAMSPTRIDLSWTDNADNETGFRIERATGAGEFGPLAIVGTNVTSYIDNTVQPNTTYRYRVFAYLDNVDSPASTIATATTPDTPPAAPTGLSATTTGNLQLTLTWTDNANNETGFTLQRATNAAFTAGLTTFTLDMNQTTYTDAPLQQNTTYYYRLQTFNAVGVSAWNTLTVVIPLLPAAPSGLVARASAANILPQNVGLTWIDRSNNETGFTIQRATGDSFMTGLTIFTVGANVRSFTDTSVQPQTVYYYRLQASNQAGYSAWSGTATVTTPALLLPPPAPTGLTVRAPSKSSLMLQWSSNSSSITNFHIERSLNGIDWQRIQTVSQYNKMYTDKNLSRLTTYWYRVQAENPAGVSEYSNVASGKTL